MVDTKARNAKNGSGACSPVSGCGGEVLVTMDTRWIPAYKILSARSEFDGFSVVLGLRCQSGVNVTPYQGE
jgi:hypothetical protein